MQYGPAALPPSPGGQNLREGIYAWPEVNRCLIEQQLVAATYGDPAALAVAPPSTRGLGAIEYLLFSESADNACAATAAINATGAWAALSAAELAGRRAVYASTAAADVAVRAEALAAAWRPGGSDFVPSSTWRATSQRTFALDFASPSSMIGHHERPRHAHRRSHRQRTG